MYDTYMVERIYIYIYIYIYIPIQSILYISYSLYIRKYTNADLSQTYDVSEISEISDTSFVGALDSEISRLNCISLLMIHILLTVLQIYYI